MNIDPDTQKQIDAIEEEIQAIKKTYDPYASLREQDEKQFEIYALEFQIDRLKDLYEF